MRSETTIIVLADYPRSFSVLLAFQNSKNAQRRKHLSKLTDDRRTVRTTVADRPQFTLFSYQRQIGFCPNIFLAGGLSAPRGPLDYEALENLSGIDPLVPARKEENRLLQDSFIILLGILPCIRVVILPPKVYKGGQGYIDWQNHLKHKLGQISTSSTTNHHTICRLLRYSTY